MMVSVKVAVLGGRVNPFSPTNPYFIIDSL